MKPHSFIPPFLLALTLLINFAFPAHSQSYDTISNWDGITPVWYVSTTGSQIVANPAPDTVNGSAHCLKFVTDSNPYNYMITELSGPVNFNINPRYRLKVLAPLSGGDITLKFENYNNSFSQEIVMTPVPGQWTDLEYDFSGLIYNDLIKMTIFPDFLGTTPNKVWYIDDILQEEGEDPGPLELESNLPIIVIDTYGQNIVDDPKISAHMGVIDNGPDQVNNINDPFNNYDGMIGIEIRGQSSQMFPKHSFGVETRDSLGENLNVPLLGLPEENDWVFYAPYSDKSMLRNIMSFEMGRETDRYCTRSVFFELVINGDYKGVYTLMEKIKKDENRVDIATLNEDEVTGDDLTGGYIIKVDKIDPDFYYGYYGWKSVPSPPYPNAMIITFQYYYPEPNDIADEQRTYIKQFITAAENRLTASNFQNPDGGYKKYFDVLSFIDQMLLNEIAKEVDKYRYSTFFYKDKDSNNGKLFAGPAWDFDLGYGNVDYWDPGLDYTGWLYNMVEPVDWGIMFWWKRMMEDPYFRDLAKTRWEYLRQDKLSYTGINSLMDSIITLTGPARERNYERWPILGTWIWPNYDWEGNTYADEVDYFKNFLFNRLGWMDNNMPGNIIHPAAGISAQANILTVHIYNDYFCKPILKKKYFELNDAPGGITVDSVIYSSSSECKLLLSQDVSSLSQLSVTISDKALNYWEDITSSTLATQGIDDPGRNSPNISVFTENHNLHIRCDRPETMKGRAVVVDLSGRQLAALSLERKTENVIPLSLPPGFYILTMPSFKRNQAFKFCISGN